MSPDYVLQNDAAFLQQLIAFNSNLPTYAPNLGLDSGQILSSQNDCDYFAYVVGAHEIMRNASIQWTNWRTITRHGPNVPTNEADTPVLPTPAPVVLPGIEDRFRALAKLIKASPGYNEAIGKALGIVRSTPAPLDLTTVKPVISLTLDGSDVFIRWSWGSHRGPLESCEIHVDRKDGKGFVLLTIDTTPNYTDTHPQPSTVTQWTYKAIYRSKDRQVGQWSDPASINVGG